MAQQVVEARVHITSLSPLVDNASFGFVIEQEGTSPTLVYSTVFAKVEAFFNVLATGGTHMPGAYLSNVYSRAANACTTELYDITAHLNGSPAGSPVAIHQFTLPTAFGAIPGPEGLCALIDFRSAYGTDVEFAPGSRPRSRDRGRIYFGGIVSQEYAAESGTNRCIWQTAFLNDMKAALLQLATSAGSADVPTWVQWSRKNAAVKNITNVSIQDAPRYQRRRVDSGSSFIVI